MRDRAIESMRFALTVIGLVLLVIYGSRAASQSGNLKLVGANHRYQQPSAVQIINFANLAFNPATQQFAKAALTQADTRSATATTAASSGVTKNSPQQSTAQPQSSAMPSALQSSSSTLPPAYEKSGKATAPGQLKKASPDTPAPISKTARPTAQTTSNQSDQVTVSKQSDL